MRSKAFAAAFLLVVLLGASRAQGAAAADAKGPVFRFTDAPGPYAVGLRVVDQYDYSRTYLPKINAEGKPTVGERARPLQTLVWYPAEKSGKKPMTVADYYALLATETSFEKPNLSTDWKQWMDASKPSMGQELWAVRDAKVLAGRFPLVVYAPSFSSMSWENADLCEYLASHGYVVVASPDMGATARGMTGDLMGINAQAEDISFLIGYAQKLPDVDMGEIAVAGFSWGGISNLFAAARDNRIDALVALDGSMRYFPKLVKDSGYVHPEDMTIPMLFFTQGAISLEDQARFFAGQAGGAPNVLNEWTHGDLVTVDDMALVHVEHSSMYQRNEDIWKSYAQNRKGDYSRADGIVGYAWVARYTLEFLDAYLKHDAEAMAFLKKTPAENGVPEHMMTVDFRAAKGVPATLEQLKLGVGRAGFDHAADVYAEMKKEKPDFKVEESAMGDWATELQADGQFADAVDVLKLNVVMHTDSSNAYETLGEAYEKAGRKADAIDSYKKALEKDADNGAAKEKLKVLEAK